MSMDHYYITGTTTTTTMTSTTITSSTTNTTTTAIDIMMNVNAGKMYYTVFHKKTRPLRQVGINLSK